MKIDFKLTDSEADNTAKYDRFVVAATEKWFEWIGWLLIVGALFALRERTESIAVDIVAAISATLAVYYFMSFFYTFTFVNIPFIKSKKVARGMSILISGGISILFVMLFQATVSVLSKLGT